MLFILITQGGKLGLLRVGIYIFTESVKLIAKNLLYYAGNTILIKKNKAVIIVLLFLLHNTEK